MKPYDQLTIIRNRHRARDLRIFRNLVETYFDEAEYDEEGIPVDWEGARAARSQINRMLPRVLEVVHAARLSGDASARKRRPALGQVEVLENIFSARYADGSDQEILDVLDQALGVYEASRFGALARTINPLYYVLSALGYVAGLPRRMFTAFGVLPLRSRAPRIGEEEISRLEAVATRLSEAEASIERRFTELRDHHARQLAENNGQLADLAERLDFAERIMAEQRPLHRLEAPRAAPTDDVVTPV